MSQKFDSKLTIPDGQRAVRLAKFGRAPEKIGHDGKKGFAILRQSEMEQAKYTVRGFPVDASRMSTKNQACARANTGLQIQNFFASILLHSV